MSGSSKKKQKADELDQTRARMNAKPVCPHCGADPVDVLMRMIQMGRVQVAQMFCGNLECRKLFGSDVVAMAPNPMEQQSPIIHRPR